MIRQLRRAGYAIYNLRQTVCDFRLELDCHIDDEAASFLCGQFIPK